MAKYIVKSSGKTERFSVRKLKRSLRKSGAPKESINQIVDKVMQRTDLDTTKKIYDFSYTQLKSIDRPFAARYSLKNALYELGPQGKRFEVFVSYLFQELGFSTDVGVVVPGACVDHEIDVQLEKDNDRSMVECKFHNRRGSKVDVKVALYIRARFIDVSLKTARNKKPFNAVWLVTNTQFTSEAIAYSSCTHMNLLGWAYPHNKGIAFLIDTLELHPITSLTCLTKKEKRMILKQNIMLCRDLIKRPDILKHLGVRQVKKVTEECKGLCPSTNY